MANRSRTEIVGEILVAVSNNDGDGIGVTRSTLMNEVYLSSAHLREYLVVLTVHGLLTYDSLTLRYNIAEKGLRYLELCNKIGEVLKEEEQEQHFGQV
jgi:predicted transcriptional regulator